MHYIERALFSFVLSVIQANETFLYQLPSSQDFALKSKLFDVFEEEVHCTAFARSP